MDTSIYHLFQFLIVTLIVSRHTMYFVIATHEKHFVFLIVPPKDLNDKQHLQHIVEHEKFQ